MWLLDGIPAYDGGTLYPTLYNCGSMCADDLDGVTDEDTQMHIVRDTDEKAFLAYAEKVQNDGFTCLFARSDAAGLYRQFQKGERLVYAYFTFADGIARILSCKNGVSLADFADNDDTHLWSDTALMQFGLWYDDMIRWTSCDCGMNYVLRLHNNKLVIIDGGEIEQSTDIALGEYMHRLRKLTNTVEGERMNIALWYCSHAHNDHMDFFMSLLRKYGDVLHVERVLFNFPSHVYSDYPYYVRDLRNVLHEFCPDALCMKPHCGQTFRLANAEFEILYTHEDLLSKRADAPVYTDVNETSTVLRICFDGGKSFLLLGDADDDVEKILCDRFGNAGLRCTYLQAAHHCINNVERLYALIDSDYVLMPQCRYIIDKRLRRVFDMICRYHNWDRVILAGDYTTVFRNSAGEIRKELYPVRGCLYDGTV